MLSGIQRAFVYSTVLCVEYARSSYIGAALVSLAIFNDVHKRYSDEKSRKCSLAFSKEIVEIISFADGLSNSFNITKVFFSALYFNVVFCSIQGFNFLNRFFEYKKNRSIKKSFHNTLSEFKLFHKTFMNKLIKYEINAVISSAICMFIGLKVNQTFLNLKNTLYLSR
ncbi:MAG: hypothetical protein JXA94_07410 [Parachlamydiales bacterium]|nr:hypothetical protein [Parachlamydiales bacterium]